jgi:hypothetical protein
VSGPRWLPGLKDVLPLIITIAVLTTGQSMLEDSDTGWHIRAGERILETGEVPRVDPFSFSAEGEPWYAWEWLADAGMGAIHRVSGLRGLVAVTAIVIALAFSIAQRLGLRLGGGAFATFGLTALAATRVDHPLAGAATHGLLRAGGDLSSGAGDGPKGSVDARSVGAGAAQRDLVQSSRRLCPRTGVNRDLPGWRASAGGATALVAAPSDARPDRGVGGDLAESVTDKSFTVISWITSARR